MIKKSFKNLFFILLVILLTFVGLYSYIKIISIDEKKDGGFAKAMPTKSNQFVCEANNYDCVKNIMVAMNDSIGNVLIFGNSQMGAINQFRKGEINYAHQLSLAMSQIRDNKLIVRSIWIPNATFGEFKEIYLAMRKCSTRIDNLVLPLFLDDMREQEIRESLQNYSSNICEGFTNQSHTKNALDSNLNISTNSDRLDKLILKKTPVLREIKSINSNLRVFLYKYRNSIFGIKATSKRKIVPAAYQFNLEALKSIIDSRESSKMQTIIYIPPLLHFASGREIPYFKDDYLNYKNEMKYICNKANCSYFDLDSIVPDNQWGYKDATSLKGDKKEIDFMHFTYNGHKIMSKKLSIIFNNLINQ